MTNHDPELLYSITLPSYMVTLVDESAHPDSYIDGFQLETNPDIVAWLKQNTPTYRVLYNGTRFEKVVWFTNSDDYILFKLTFDISA
jgi:hypothetical protein